MASKQLLARIAAVRAPGGQAVAAPPGLRALAVEIGASANSPGQAAARNFFRKYAPVLSYALASQGDVALRMTLRRTDAAQAAPRVVATFADGATKELPTTGTTDEALFKALTGGELEVPAPKRRRASGRRAARKAGAGGGAGSA